MKCGLLAGPVGNTESVPLCPGNMRIHTAHTAPSQTANPQSSKTYWVLLPSHVPVQIKLVPFPLAGRRSGRELSPWQSGDPKTGRPGSQGLGCGEVRQWVLEIEKCSICKHSRGSWNFLIYNSQNACLLNSQPLKLLWGPLPTVASASGFLLSDAGHF